MHPQIFSNIFIMFGRDEKRSDERIGEDCEEVVKREKENSCLKEFVTRRFGQNGQGRRKVRWKKYYKVEAQ